MENMENITENNKKKSKFKFIFIASLILIIGVLFFSLSGGDEDGNQNVNVVSEHKDTGVPTDSTDPNYQEKIKEYNDKAAEKALQDGTSYIATPVNKVKEEEVDLTQFEQKEASGVDTSDNLSKNAQEPEKVIEIREHVIYQEVPVNVEKPYDYKEDYELFQFFNSMNTNNANSQNKTDLIYVSNMQKREQLKQQQEANKQNQQQIEQAKNEQINKDMNNVAIYKIGDLIPATLLTPVDSREPSFIRARIEAGPLMGSIVTGSYKQNNASVSIVFDNLNLKNSPQSIAISGMALDYNSASTAMRHYVNRHIPEKLLMTMVGTFAKGFADGLKNNNKTTETRTINDNNNNDKQITIDKTTPKTNKDLIKEAGADTISQATDVLQSFIPEKPTVKVYGNSEIGIYVTSDWVIDKSVIEK